MSFVNTNFKVGPSSSAQSAHALCCYWLGATRHWPKIDAQKCLEHSKNKKIQAEGTVSADTNTATHI